jgi:hypothetical protein
MVVKYDEKIFLNDIETHKSILQSQVVVGDVCNDYRFLLKLIMCNINSSSEYWDIVATNLNLACYGSIWHMLL